MRAERLAYPFVEGERGIPFDGAIDAFREKGKSFGIMKSGSGAELRYTIGSDRLAVRDVRYPDRFMDADVENGIATFNLRTRSSFLDNHTDSPAIHSDMFAAKFVSFALQYFEENHVSMDACKGIWWPETINGKMFARALSEHGDSVLSAKETWSGKLFISLGFTELVEGDIGVEETRTDEFATTAIFRRPDRESD